MIITPDDKIYNKGFARAIICVKRILKYEGSDSITLERLNLLQDLTKKEVSK